MNPETSFKRCPRCGMPAALSARACDRCGREYRTVVTAPQDRTLMLPAELLDELKAKEAEEDPLIHPPRPQPFPRFGIVLAVFLFLFAALWAGDFPARITAGAFAGFVVSAVGLIGCLLPGVLQRYRGTVRRRRR